MKKVSHMIAIWYYACICDYLTIEYIILVIYVVRAGL